MKNGISGILLRISLLLAVWEVQKFQDSPLIKGILKQDFGYKTLLLFIVYVHSPSEIRQHYRMVYNIYLEIVLFYELYFI